MTGRNIIIKVLDRTGRSKNVVIIGP